MMPLSSNSLSISPSRIQKHSQRKKGICDVIQFISSIIQPIQLNQGMLKHLPSRLLTQCLRDFGDWPVSVDSETSIGQFMGTFISSFPTPDCIMG
jgi:hypothetical protein